MTFQTTYLDSSILNVKVYNTLDILYDAKLQTFQY